MTVLFARLKDLANMAKAKHETMLSCFLKLRDEITQTVDENFPELSYTLKDQEVHVLRRNDTLLKVELTTTDYIVIWQGGSYSTFQTYEEAFDELVKAFRDLIVKGKV